MNKKILAIVICLIVIVAASSIIAIQIGVPNARDGDSNNGKENNSFNIVFRYGIGAKNELNTFNGTFTKDLVINGSVTATLILSKEELEGLHQKIIEMDLFAYPDSFPPHPNRRISPQDDYYLRVQSGSAIKELSWNINSQIESNIQENLNQLTEYITALIEQQPEYKALPTPTGAYQ